MSESKFSLQEELLSPELFSDPEIGTQTSVAGTSDDTSSTSAGLMEPDFNSKDLEWKGISMEEIYKHHGPFDWHHLPPIHPSPSHTILFELPLPNRGPPKSYPLQQNDKWNQNFVRMPHSVHSLYPVDSENESVGGFRRRWDVIQEALLQNLMSSHQLEAAILSYNNKYAERWDFAALHHLLNEYIDEEETKMCLGSLIPKMVHLALQLPHLITGPIPLLKRQSNQSISLSQLQVASLLANAFFCTFPRRNSTNPQAEYGSYPYINFNRLYSSFRKEKLSRCQSVMEKLRCIFHYFHRVTTRAPEGVITIQRKYIPKNNCPRWDKQHMKLPLLHITSKGTIESQGKGLLQVDFANKFVGGGVLNYGCVQEEIRFVICPELMVTMLVTEALDDTEALIINGVERYSRYEGYSNNFKWVGDFIDETPRDNSGRLKTCIVAIDALHFKHPNVQFSMGNVIRELNKAFVGFSSEVSSNNLPAIATGNWGCGAFRGNPQLKVLVQLMAAAVAGRSIVYFTFGDTNLRDSVADMYWHLIRHDVDIARLFTLISEYQEMFTEKHSDFYRFLYNRSKMKPLTHYFNSNSKSPTKKPNYESSETSKKNAQFNSDFKVHASIAKQKEDELKKKIEDWLENVEDNIDSKECSKVQKEQEKIEKQNKIEKNCINNEGDDKIESVTNKNNTSPNRKKMQTFSELFEEKTYKKTSEETISNLDVLDALLDDTIDNSLQQNAFIETDIKIEKNDKKEFKNQANKIKKNRNIQNSKKELQKKIDDFFKKKNS